MDKEKIKSKDLITVLLVVGIGGIVLNLNSKFEKYYLGENLIEIVIEVDDPPVYVQGGKLKTSRYSFSGTGYVCSFWLSEGTLSLIRDSERTEQRIKSIKKGDTVSIKIRQTEEKDLQNIIAAPQVIELAKNQEIIIRASDVEADGRKWYYISWGVPIAALVIWGIIQIWRRAKKLNTYFHEPVE